MPSPSAPFPACRRGACAPGGGCPGQSSGASGVAPSLSALAGSPPSAPLGLAASRRCGSAALRCPRRAGSGLAVRLALRAAPASPRRGLGRWPPGAAGAATGRQCRPRRDQGQGQGPGQAAVRGPGGCRPPSPGCSGRSRPHDVLTIPKLLILYLTSPFKRGILGVGRASPHGSLKFPPPCRNSTAVGTAFFFPTLCGAGGGVPNSPTPPRPSPIRARGAEEQAPSPYTIYPRAQQNLRLFC